MNGDDSFNHDHNYCGPWAPSFDPNTQKTKKVQRKNTTKKKKNYKPSPVKRVSSVDSGLTDVDSIDFFLSDELDFSSENAPGR